VKQATTGSRKGEPSQVWWRQRERDRVGIFMALETLSLVSKEALALDALKEISDRYPPLDSIELDELIERADAQRRVLERERLAASRQALHDEK